MLQAITRLRSRWPRRPVTAIIILTIIAGVATAIPVWPHARWWLIVIAAGISVIIPSGASAVASTAQRRRESAKITRTELQGVSRRRGGLPYVKDANLAAKAHRSVLAIPYIHRDAEDAVRNHLNHRTPVLLIGSSMVGKTRLAAEVITESFADWQVVIPDNKSALAKLDAAEVPFDQCVIWLDNVETLVGPDGITSGALDRLAQQGNVIIATIRAIEYDKIRPTSERRMPIWDIISTFEPVFISRELTHDEQQRIDSAVSDPGTRDRIREIGIGEFVGAAAQITQALKLGEAGAGGVGYALILGSADWYRCGMNRPVPASLLAELAKSHVDPRGLAQLDDPATFAAGLSWATREINPTASLLIPSGASTYSIYDYALDLISKHGEPIPDNNWMIASRQANANELVAVGNAAEFFGHLDLALANYMVASKSQNTDVTPWANYHLGTMLIEHWNNEGARESFLQAIDSGEATGDTEVVPWALLHLGIVLQVQGDFEGALNAYQRAINSEMPHVKPHSLCNTGRILHVVKNDIEGARNAYQQAIDSAEATDDARSIADAREMLDDLNAGGGRYKDEFYINPRGKFVFNPSKLAIGRCRTRESLGIR